MREHSLEVPAPAKWGEGLVAVAEGEPIAVEVRLESVHEGILVTARESTPSTPASADGACATSPSPSKSSFRSFSRILERKQLTSRFKTTTWILKLRSGMRLSCRFRFSRCVSRIAPASIRLRASD